MQKCTSHKYEISGGQGKLKQNKNFPVYFHTYACTVYVYVYNIYIFIAHLFDTFSNSIPRCIKSLHYIL